MLGVLLETGPLDVCRQMALDEAMAEAFAGSYAARFYRWSGRGVTFGYAQSLSEVRKALPEKARNWPSARRPTGGGVVVHDDDITFSCVFPASPGFSAERVYAGLHGALRAALSSRGVMAELKSGPVRAGGYAPSEGGVSSACFSNPVPQDLLGPDGGKILGGALRRYENAVLYQGSLQLSGARAMSGRLEAALAEGLSRAWGVELKASSAGSGLLNECERLAASRYSTADWNGRF